MPVYQPRFRLPASLAMVAQVDPVEAELQRSLPWRLAGLAMRLGRPALLAYRGWRPRRLLEKKPG